MESAGPPVIANSSFIVSVSNSTTFNNDTGDITIQEDDTRPTMDRQLMETSDFVEDIFSFDSGQMYPSSTPVAQTDSELSVKQPDQVPTEPDEPTSSSTASERTPTSSPRNNPFMPFLQNTPLVAGLATASILFLFIVATILAIRRMKRGALKKDKTQDLVGTVRTSITVLDQSATTTFFNSATGERKHLW